MTTVLYIVWMKAPFFLKGPGRQVARTIAIFSDTDTGPDIQTRRQVYVTGKTEILPTPEAGFVTIRVSPRF